MKPTNPIFFLIDEMLLADRDRYITYKEILESYAGPFENTPRKTDTVKGHKYHNALLDAMKLIKKLLRDEGFELEYKNGKDASAGFRYPKGVEDPMWRKKTEHRQMRTENLKRLIQASVGLFPTSWLSEILSGAQSLAADKEKFIIFDQNQHLKQIQWVPTIFEAIEKQQVLNFSYNPKYKGEVVELLFHPYCLKEYNQRWFVFGHATDVNGKPLQFSNCPIDRIVGDIVVCQGV